MNKTNPIQIWLNSVAYSHSQSKATEEQYKKVIRKYTKFIKQTPEQIIQEYENTEQNHTPERTIMRKNSQKIQQWIIELEKKGLTPASIRTMTGVIMSFYKYNDLILGKIPMPKNRITYHNRDIEKDEINKIIALSPIRERAFMTIMAQSGLRPCTIKQLKIKDIEKILEPNTPIPCKIDVRSEIEKGKLGEGHPTFIAEEAIKYTKQYLTTKKNLTPESLLFTTQDKKEISEKNVSRTFKQKADKLNKTGQLNYEIRIDKPSELRLYNLRKYFRKYANQMGFEHVNYLMNHITKGSDSNYTPKDAEFYRELYKTKAMPFLTLEKPTLTEYDKIVKTQEQKHQKEMETIKTQQNENKKLKAQLEKIQERMEVLEQIYTKMRYQVEASTPEERKTILLLKPKAIEKLKKDHPEYWLTDEQDKRFMEWQKKHPEWNPITDGANKEMLEYINQPINKRLKEWQKKHPEWKPSDGANKELLEYLHQPSKPKTKKQP